MSNSKNEQLQEAECCTNCGLPHSKLPGGMIYKNGVLLCVDHIGCKERATTVDQTPLPDR